MNTMNRREFVKLGAVLAAGAASTAGVHPAFAGMKDLNLLKRKVNFMSDCRNNW